MPITSKQVSTCHKQWFDQKVRASRLEPRDLCLIQQKAFTGKHKIGDHWENIKYIVAEWQYNLPVHTIKLWQGGWKTWLVHRNLLIHIAPPYWQEGIQSELEDSDYDTLPRDVWLSEPTPSTIGPAMWSPTRGHLLAQSIQDAWTKVVQHVQWKWKNNLSDWPIADGPCHENEYRLSIA